jgi:aromatic-L-amino-acid decarboxylase
MIENQRLIPLSAEYLKTSEDARAVNLMDYGLQLGRRFRALKFWFVLRYFGRERVIEILRSHIGWAREFVSCVEADPKFERRWRRCRGLFPLSRHERSEPVWTW